MALAPHVQRLVALPFPRERYARRVASVVERYERMLRIASGASEHQHRDRVELMFVHPSAWSEMEHLDEARIAQRLESARLELTNVRAAAPIPAAPDRVDRTRVLAVADLEWLARETRVLERRARRLGVERSAEAYAASARPDPIPGADVALVAALREIPRGTWLGALRQIVSLRHQVEDLDAYLAPTPPAVAFDPSRHVAIGRFEDLREGRAKRVDVGGTTIAVFRHEGRLCALEDTCPHRGGPLGKGEVEEGHVFCPLHGWAFDLKTGLMRGNARVAVRTFDAGVDDDGTMWVGPPR